ncbi:MAG: phosphotransferase [Actinomycetaceae bacterium]|nr:phosphotransferase [Actinomycetaceae bacterium]
MSSNSLYLAALAVAAIDGLEAVGTRPPFVNSDDYAAGGVLDSNGRHWMVKCPKNSHASTLIEAEAALAPWLLEELRRGNLPFDIIRPAGFANAATGGRALIFPEPFGHAVAWDDVSEVDAREIGRTLASIHSLDPDVVANAGLPVYTANEWRQRLLAELHDVDASSPLPPALRRRWEEALQDMSLWDFEATVVHGDIDAENFLWSNGSITTVTGFGEAKVADPALDLAPFFLLEEAVYASVIESYENTRGIALDDAMYNRMILMSELAVPRWLMHGIRTDNRSIQDEARVMLDEHAREVDELDDGSRAWTVD